MYCGVLECTLFTFARGGGGGVQISYTRIDPEEINFEKNSSKSPSSALKKQESNFRLAPSPLVNIILQFFAI